ncbi:MAG: hypothetical protein LBQ76_02980 [Candidatus Fibromonas sp.]|jgi:hypothetical protein|nr:hypothetical protein [Candidatus Fibromonas sp.]
MEKASLDPVFLQELDLFVLQNYIEDNSVIAKGLPKEYEEAENYAKENRKSFMEVLAEMIEKYNKTGKEKLNNVSLYKKANISKQTYHKQFSKDRPSKDSAVSYALALELCVSDMEKLLASAGWSLATNSKRDLMIRFCFLNKIYEYSEVCEILETKGEKKFRNL